VARAAVSGLSNKQLAQRLGVSEGTIKNHLHAIYERLRLEGRRALLLYLKEQSVGARSEALRLPQFKNGNAP
jgi:DNA-binding NarL/FixJ family response regulator